MYLTHNFHDSPVNNSIIFEQIELNNSAYSEIKEIFTEIATDVRY